MKRNRFEDSEHRQRESAAFMMHTDEAGDRIGAVRTPYGNVLVFASDYASGPDGFGPVSGLWFIYDGREYHRRYNKRFNDSGLTRVAAKFARVVAYSRGA